ncbi:MAG TPA: hypothetical protein DCZ72_08975 [Armatimonadetes bacterium]|nr:hypothetical protein [Armatimonadota bacterium]
MPTLRRAVGDSHDTIPVAPGEGWSVPDAAMEATLRLGGLAACRRLVREGDWLVSISQPDGLQLPLADSLAGSCATSARAVLGNLDERRLHARERAMLVESGADYLLAVPVVRRRDEAPCGVVVGLRRAPLGPGSGEDSRHALVLLAELLAQGLRLHESQARWREAHAEAVQARGEAEGILHGVRAPALVLTADCRLHDANRAAEVLLGFHLPRSRGKEITEVIEDHAVAQVLIEASDGGTGQTPLIHVQRPQEATYEVRLTPVFDARGELHWNVVVFNDTTTLRQADELKSEFLSAVSHELRTPLTSIKAFASTLLRTESAKPEEQREWLKIIDHECDRLTSLVNDLLVISRYDTGQPIVLSWANVDLGLLLQQIGEAYQAGAHRHTVEYVGPPEVHLVADGDRLRQVFSNLISNAIKYSPRGGPVQIIVEETEADVRVLVRDQGVGIRPEHLNAIFERFYQVDGGTTRRVGGAGLGLYLTRFLVESHGGAVWAESELGKGSTLVVVLPKLPPLAVQ